MGFFLTVLYCAFALVSPASVFPELAPFRIQLWIAGLALLASVPNLHRSRLFSLPQTYLMLGLIFATGWSLIANRWFGGALAAWENFIPSATVFFLIVLNCTSLARLRTLAIIVVATALTIALSGIPAYWFRPDTSTLVLVENSPAGELHRLRGLGFLNDPNDLAQFFVLCMATLAIAWRKNPVWNLVVVVIPTAIFAYSVYLTHSRGAVLAIAVVLLLALREKLGHFASVTLTTIAVLGMLALNFGAGRGLADESTSNRLQAWGAGIAFLKDSPLFGIGYGQFQDAFEITAHNSWILCAAELGLFGFFFWTGLIVFSLADLNGILKSVSRTDVKLRSSADGEAHTEAVEPSPAATDQEQQILRWARWIRLALAGFLAAAWFLSRAYVMTLYLYIGIAVALRAIAEQHSPHPEPTVTRHSIRKLALVTVGMEVVSVLFLYVIVRVRPV